MKVIVTGGRDFRDQALLESVLGAVYRHVPHDLAIVHGACPTGVDSMAESWAHARGIHTIPYPADWTAYGKAAGPMRNAVMVHGGADLAVAFPGGRGTEDCVRRLQETEIPLVWIGPRGAFDVSNIPEEPGPARGAILGIFIYTSVSKMESESESESLMGMDTESDS